MNGKRTLSQPGTPIETSPAKKPSVDHSEELARAWAVFEKNPPASYAELSGGPTHQQPSPASITPPLTPITPVANVPSPWQEQKIMNANHQLHQMVVHESQAEQQRDIFMQMQAKIKQQQDEVAATLALLQNERSALHAHINQLATTLAILQNERAVFQAKTTEQQAEVATMLAMLQNERLAVQAKTTEQQAEVDLLKNEVVTVLTALQEDGANMISTLEAYPVRATEELQRLQAQSRAALHIIQSRKEEAILGAEELQRMLQNATTNF